MQVLLGAWREKEEGKRKEVVDSIRVLRRGDCGRVTGVNDFAEREEGAVKRKSY
jgi:hypothetical protein